MIELRQLFFDYKAMPMYFDLNVQRAEKIAIIGASGAGKSTLLNLIAGFEQANRGEIYLNQQNHTRTLPAQRPVSMLFQENNLFPHLNVTQNILLGIDTRLKPTQAQQEVIQQVAEQVGLSNLLDRLPNQLSGGQKQRVAIARCLLRDKPILLLDEPFSALDPKLREEMFTLVLELCNKKHITLLLVTHQQQEIAQRVDRLIEIEQGTILST